MEYLPHDLTLPPARDGSLTINKPRIQNGTVQNVGSMPDLFRGARGSLSVNAQPFEPLGYQATPATHAALRAASFRKLSNIPTVSLKPSHPLPTIDDATQTELINRIKHVNNTVDHLASEVSSLRDSVVRLKRSQGDTEPPLIGSQHAMPTATPRVEMRQYSARTVRCRHEPPAPCPPDPPATAASTPAGCTPPSSAPSQNPPSPNGNPSAPFHAHSPWDDGKQFFDLLLPATPRSNDADRQILIGAGSAVHIGSVHNGAPPSPFNLSEPASPPQLSPEISCAALSALQELAAKDPEAHRCLTSLAGLEASFAEFDNPPSAAPPSSADPPANTLLNLGSPIAKPKPPKPVGTPAASRKASCSPAADGQPANPPEARPPAPSPPAHKPKLRPSTAPVSPETTLTHDQQSGLTTKLFKLPATRPRSAASPGPHPTSATTLTSLLSLLNKAQAESSQHHDTLIFGTTGSHRAYVILLKGAVVAGLLVTFTADTQPKPVVNPTHGSPYHHAITHTLAVAPSHLSQSVSLRTQLVTLFMRDVSNQPYPTRVTIPSPPQHEPVYLGVADAFSDSHLIGWHGAPLSRHLIYAVLPFLPSTAPVALFAHKTTTNIVLMPLPDVPAGLRTIPQHFLNHRDPHWVRTGSGIDDYYRDPRLIIFYQHTSNGRFISLDSSTPSSRLAHLLTSQTLAPGTGSPSLAPTTSGPPRTPQRKCSHTHSREHKLRFDTTDLRCKPCAHCGGAHWNKDCNSSANGSWADLRRRSSPVS
jgi:hypothetical protein